MANINPIQKYKPNDPYYYEVDNIPIEGLEQNIITVNDELIDFQSTVQTNYATNNFVENEIAAQYVTTQNWVSNNYYDSGDLFFDWFGAASYGVPKVYTKDQIDTKSNLATDSVLNVFFRDAILPTNIDLTSFWNGGSAHILDQYVTVANIGAAATLTQDQVDAIQTRPYDTGGPGLSTTNSLVAKGDLQIEIPDISRQALRAAGAASDPPSTTNPYATREFVNNSLGAPHMIEPFALIGYDVNSPDPFTITKNNTIPSDIPRTTIAFTSTDIPPDAKWLYAWLKVKALAETDHPGSTYLYIYNKDGFPPNNNPNTIAMVVGTYAHEQADHDSRANSESIVTAWIPISRDGGGNPQYTYSVDVNQYDWGTSYIGITILGYK